MKKITGIVLEFASLGQVFRFSFRCRFNCPCYRGLGHILCHGALRKFRWVALKNGNHVFIEDEKGGKKSSFSKNEVKNDTNNKSFKKEKSDSSKTSFKTKNAENPLKNNSSSKTNSNNKSSFKKSSAFPSKSARSKDSKPIAGVMRGKPMSFEEAGGKKVNPNFESDEPGYKSNCTACIAVFEARLRGYDLEAKPYNDNAGQRAKILVMFPYFAFKTTDGSNMKAPIKFNAKDKEDCICILNKNIKNNERYVFRCFLKGNKGVAHVIEVAKIDNKLKFYDPQCGELYDNIPNNIVFKKDDDSDYNQEYIFRVDNLDVDPTTLTQVAQPAEGGNL